MHDKVNFVILEDPNGNKHKIRTVGDLENYIVCDKGTNSLKFLEQATQSDLVSNDIQSLSYKISGIIAENINIDINAKARETLNSEIAIFFENYIKNFNFVHYLGNLNSTERNIILSSGNSGDLYKYNDNLYILLNEIEYKILSENKFNEIRSNYYTKNELSGHIDSINILSGKINALSTAFEEQKNTYNQTDVLNSLKLYIENDVKSNLSGFLINSLSSEIISLSSICINLSSNISLLSSNIDIISGKLIELSGKTQGVIQ